MYYNPLFGTHLPVLIKLMSMTNGAVLELGVGSFSTPILHWLCFEQGRKLVSYETNKEYYELFKHHSHPKFHEVKFVEDWSKIDIESTKWSIALVDHHPQMRRREEAKRLVNNCDFVVLHDTELSHEKLYRYRDLRRGCFPQFKYKYEYKKTSPETTVLSNIIDISKIL